MRPSETNKYLKKPDVMIAAVMREPGSMQSVCMRSCYRGPDVCRVALALGLTSSAQQVSRNTPPEPLHCFCVVLEGPSPLSLYSIAIPAPMRPLTTRAALLRPFTSTPSMRAKASVKPTRVPRPPHCRFSSTQAPATEKLSPRWLSDVRARIGKCIMFGINDAQTSEAGSILQEVSRDWRELLAGSEGFLTGQEYRGLYRQEVVWGEMVGHVNKEDHAEG